MDVDLSTVLMPLLAGVASAIGNSCKVGVKGRDWTEPSVLWCAVIAPSATLKTSAQSYALAPLQSIFDDRFRDHLLRKRMHADEKRIWESDKSCPPPSPPPPFEQPLVVDTTVEALVSVLAKNPKGVLLARDELAAWLQSFNQFKSGRGNDQESWLSMYDAQRVIVNRKTEDRMAVVPHAAVSITGTVQPGTLREIIKPHQFRNGLIPRFAFVMPPLHDHRWSPHRSSPENFDRLKSRLAELLSLDARVSRIVPFSPEAEKLWIPWHDARFSEALDSDDPLRAALAKSVGRAARFALIFELVSDPSSGSISSDSLSRAIALADWLNHETARIYAQWHQTPDEAYLAAIAEVLERKGPEATVRDILRSSRLLMEEARSAGVRDALEKLIDRGLGEWADDKKRTFRYLPPPPSSTGDPNAPE